MRTRLLSGGTWICGKTIVPSGLTGPQLSFNFTVRTELKGVLSMKEVPIWEKSNLTLEEAAAYSGIGINKLRDLTSEQNCQFVLWVGASA